MPTKPKSTIAAPKPADTASPRPRGRPPKSATASTPVKATPLRSEQKVTSAATLKRGSVKKATAENSTADPADPAPEVRSRGRPKSTTTTAAPPPTPKRKQEEEPELADAPPKKRGRPSKSDSAAKHKTEAKPVLRMQRVTKATDTRPTSKPVTKPSTAKLDARSNATRPTASATAKAKSQADIKPQARIGRPPGAKNLPKTDGKVKKSIGRPSAAAAETATSKKKSATKQASQTANTDLEDLVNAEEDEGEAQYWLMKAEPDSRIEKGVDVAFSIDILASKSEPEPWDGVRNPVARNKMRAMRKNDLAFFYHSNTKVPGIVGVMRIVEEHSPDPGAFDPTHPYYDPKSDRSKPKWDMVKVEFVKKFKDIIDLKTLKSTPELSEMQIARKEYGRLSVQSVRPSEWRFVLSMAGEDEKLGESEPANGYEADTNGEEMNGAPEEEEPIAVQDDKPVQVQTESANLAAYGIEENGKDQEMNKVDTSPVIADNIPDDIDAKGGEQLTTEAMASDEVMAKA